MDDIQSEPQADVPVSGSATEEQAVESTPAKEDVTFSEAQQQKLNSIVAEKAFDLRQARRENKALEEKIAQMEAAKPAQKAPEVPELDPDLAYSNPDAFAQQVAERDRAMKERASLDAEARIREQQQAYAAQQSQAKAMIEMQKQQADYMDRAKKAGIDEQSVGAYVSVIKQAHLTPEVENLLLVSDEGPRLTQYLAKNPDQLISFAEMDPLNAALYLGEVKSKLGARKSTNAPNPLGIEQSSGSTASKDPMLKGVIYS